jgi:RNA polymerase sigma factor (sigma-70 family)
MTLDDTALVREYACNNSSEAFSELVNRHVHLVYSVALRQVRDPHLAEEITQVVFIVLARKAHSFGPKTVLPAWLCRTARYASANALKVSNRRQRYEQRAQQEASMSFTANEPESETWREIAPILDDALSSLGEKEHNAIILRFFEGKDFKQVAAALNTGEDAARMRVNRALEKLRKFFSKRGVASTTAIIAGQISANAVHAAPAALAHAVVSTAVVKGTAAAASTATLVSGTLKAIAWARIKFACGIAIAIFLAASLAGVGIAFFPQSMQDDRNDRYQMEGSFNYGDVFFRDFIVTVNGSNWAINLHNMKDPPGSSSPLSQEDVCLNGTIYSYDDFGNSGGAMIHYGDSAVEDGSFADFVWVGLASGYYFSRATNDQVTSLFAQDGDHLVWRYHAEWQLNDGPPYLPKSIDYFEGPLHKATVGLVMDKVWKGGEVRVLQSTNINGRIFPTEYTYEQFQPKNYDFTSTNVQHQLWVTVKVKKIILHDVPDVLPPKTVGITQVNDYRLPITLHLKTFHTTYGTIYSTTARRLPEKPDTAAIDAYKTQLKQLHMPYPPPDDR